VLSIPHHFSRVEHDGRLSCERQVHRVVGSCAQINGKAADGADRIGSEKGSPGGPYEVASQQDPVQLSRAEGHVNGRQRSTLRVHLLGPSYDACNGRASLKQFDARFNGVGQQLVVGVEEDDELSPCHPEPSIASCADAGIPLSGQSDSASGTASC
jgi:hypothetical protein